MTERELILLLSERFFGRFADLTARRVLDDDAVGLLYDLVTTPARLPAAVRHKVLFRGAYVLERIYFGWREAWMPHAEDFCRRAFAECADASARRHFAKIMADLLRHDPTGADALERIAEAAAEWAVDPAARVSVRVWSVEVLKCCRERVGWVAQTWDDLVEAMALDATPGIRCRIRTSWREGR